ncbi:tRNA (adenosine(37)-N6)-dimethylallyltransferase MiaA [Arcanobacterium haemolyticum]|nr:tRNA (adenosine(37)-N6)-dimethylallyltransferase MiaA [Arcanobacterium haemolyticum]
MKPRIFAIVGPTASGKTALSLRVAGMLGGPDAVEIISADAMQLYRGMDIGTAKLPVAQREGIVHHQLDVLDIADEASVAAYQREARSDLEDILSRGKHALVVGGSGLYVAGLLDELDFPGHDDDIRADLEKTIAKEGLAPLHAELRDKDRQSFETIDLANPRRVVRALEVIRLTGRPYTPRFPRHTSHYSDVRAFAIDRDKEALNASIYERALDMLNSGLVDETRGLLEQGLRDAPTASRATGYREAIALVDGAMTEHEAVESIAQATRRLAKKQRTWFRADPRLTWLDLSEHELDEAARAIVSDAIA